MKTVIKLTILCTLLSSISAHAQVITDGSMGNKTYHGTAHNLPLDSNNTIIVSQDMGTKSGNNLFHSFKTFNINPDESVTFTGSHNLNNIISRVTGGEISNINGTLKLADNLNANFYFINPAGIFFGQNAAIDVPAAFHISTSDSLHFQDGHVFLAALAANTNSLSIAEPESFGFLGHANNSNALIEISGSQLNLNHLNNQTGQSLDLVAGNIKINNNAQLLVQSGEIRLIAMQGTESVSLLKDSNGNLALPSIKPTAINAGSIILDNPTHLNGDNGNIDTKGEGGGYITLWGGKTIIKNTDVYADNIGDTNATTAKGINIHSYSLNVNNSLVSFDTYDGTGDSKNAKVYVETSHDLNIKNGGAIKANAYTNGDAANVEINANELIIDKQNSALSTGIYSQANADESDYTANAGKVLVNAKTVAILNSGVIFTTTNSYGNGGNITVNANNILIDGYNVDAKTGIFSDANRDSTGGNAGNINVQADKLKVINGGSISASTYNSGNAGDITIQANNIDVSGINNLGRLNNGILASAIYEYDNHGYLGHGGNIAITSNQAIHLYNDGNISTQNQVKDENNNTKSRFGNISIKATDIKLDSDSIINAQSTDSANAGSINLFFKNALTINNAVITTQANSGNGGNINAFGKIINLSHQAKINTYTTSGIKGGNINGSADILLMNNVSVQTYADNAANGGDITLNLKGIIPSQNQLQTNGKAVNNSDFDMPVLNIIKTAHSGRLILNTPQLNLSGSLGELDYKNVEIPDLNKDSCQNNDFIDSSLSKVGKGNISINEKSFVFVPQAIITKQLPASITPSLVSSNFNVDNYPCASLYN